MQWTLNSISDKSSNSLCTAGKLVMNSRGLHRMAFIQKRLRFRQRDVLSIQHTTKTAVASYDVLLTPFSPSGATTRLGHLTKGSNTRAGSTPVKAS